MVRGLDDPVAAGLPNERQGPVGPGTEVRMELLGREVIEQIGTDQDLVEIIPVYVQFW